MRKAEAIQRNYSVNRGGGIKEVQKNTDEMQQNTKEARNAQDDI